MPLYNIRAIHGTGWKLIRVSDGTAEQVDRSDDQPAILDGLEDELDAWLASFNHAEASGDVAMDADTKARLEDLGYLQ